MKTQLKVDVRGITLELDTEEAKAFLRDPKHVQTEVRIFLRNAGVEVPENTVNGKTRKPMERKACPVCEKLFDPRGIRAHIKGSHSEVNLTDG